MTKKSFYYFIIIIFVNPRLSDFNLSYVISYYKIHEYVHSPILTEIEMIFLMSEAQVLVLLTNHLNEAKIHYHRQHLKFRNENDKNNKNLLRYRCI